jgi:maleylpyruvate isomerase
VGTDTFDRRQLDADLASCVASHAALVAWLRSLQPVDPAAATSLPGWTVGHVLTHVARNADSHVELLDGRPQYPSPRARDDDIAAGAGRSWSVLVDDVATSAAALDARWAATHDWSGTATMLAGSRPRHLLPLLRQREVEVHRSDLGLGYRFADMPARYVRRDLGLMEMLWRARKPMGLTPLPDAARRLAPPLRLAWMLGRADVEGLPPADLL